MATNFLASDEWQTMLSNMIDNVGSAQFCHLLSDACQRLTGYESSVILMYTLGRTPEWAFENLSPELSRHYRRNLSAEYLLDPFYTLYENRAPSGIYRLQDIAPDNFFESEVYKKYYLPNGIIDETGVFIKLSEDTYLLLDMANREIPKITTGRIRRLQAVLPVVESLCLKHYQTIKEKQTDSDQGNFIGSPLERAFHNFGKDHLSNRECEVIQLILKGHSTKSIARLLEISIDTVKVYNKRFHSKLKVSSQAELFSLFLESISTLPSGSEEDPLTHYLKITEK